ncbi:MAG: hypothetical protein E7434_04595 [Ruminococcaceae bacterium]|nr:hypothetical protein [Oscillospiraceae bacterium]
MKEENTAINQNLAAYANVLLDAPMDELEKHCAEMERNEAACQKFVDFHNSITGEQTARLADHMKIFRLLSCMTENELIFTEVFLDNIFGGYFV